MADTSGAEEKVPQEVKDLCAKLLEACDSKECYDYIESEVEKKGGDYTEEGAAEGADDSSKGEQEEMFSTEDMPKS